MINKETLQNYIIYTTHITILNLQTLFKFKQTKKQNKYQN